ncbi:MAG: hypothetical protein Q4D51_08145 [Eubacteriales bacterium]|nr:hypothetical protein [Eubacteriales bacterium]
MKYENVYFINGTAYAGKSTMVKLLAEKFDGVACEENYHDVLMDELDSKEYPNITYLRDMQDWSAFVRRTPEEYSNWIDGVCEECGILEQKLLDEMVKQTSKKIFVDTNIPLEVLREISDENHVLIMLADPNISVERFFDRPDSEKQFLYQVLLKEDNPEQAIANFRACLEKINSPEVYKAWEQSGFKVIKRDENRSVEETFKLVKEAFGLLSDGE